MSRTGAGGNGIRLRRGASAAKKNIMKRTISRQAALVVMLLFVLGVMGGCVYFNTFYNARKAFDDAESTRKASRVSGGRINQAQYRIAIDKSTKVIEDHPNSSYYDDALYVLGVSYFWTGNYGAAERRLRELLANYANSKYAKEARLYLAKAKLEENEMDDAMELFEEIFRGKYSKELKAEAAVALGKHHLENKDFKDAKQYFLALRDSLGTPEEKKWAQMQIADGLFETFQSKDALGAYLQILGMDPEPMEKYHALFQAAECAYRLQKLEVGNDYLTTLINDELYFDSLGVLKLELAYGHQLQDDLVGAEQLYDDVAKEDVNRFRRGEADYQLGLMYQFDYDDLAKAKEYYDKTVDEARGNPSGKDALQRSSDIGKLDTYKRTLVIDSTTTQDMIDDAAYTQYQLAELYYLSLNKPDTAMIEMQYVIDSFPSAYDAPAALIALSEMYRSYRNDTTAADSLLHLVLQNYPHSDYIGEVLDVLGLKGTPADTGYAGVYLSKAEDFLDDEKEIDSARYYYKYIVDNFPDSKYYLKARFALIWTRDEYEPPGDSSVYYAYKDFIDSFPQSDLAKEAQMRITYSPPAGTLASQQDTVGAFDSLGDSTGVFALQDSTRISAAQQSDTAGYIDPLKQLYIDPNGDTAVDLGTSVKILNQREQFEYPIEAYSTGWEGSLYFQLFLDFSGEVSDLILKTHSPSQEIDDEATRAVKSMTFDIQAIPLQFQGKWYVYKFQVTLPDQLR